MDGIGSEVYGAAGSDEVVDADAALGGKVPDAGVGVGAVIDDGVIGCTEGGVLVVGPEDAAGALNPGGEAAGRGEVPAEDDRCKRNAGEGATDGEGRAAESACDAGGAGLGAGVTVIFLNARGIGLPERKELRGIFEVATKETGSMIAGKDFAGVDACHQELEIIAILSNTKAPLNQRTQLKGESGGSGLCDSLLSRRRG